MANTIRFIPTAVLAGFALPMLLGAANPSYPMDSAPGKGVPLSLTRGEIYRVANVSQLKSALDAANRARQPATLLLADGAYILDVPTLNIQCPGLVVRSAGGQRDAVVVRGPDEGTNAAVANVFLISANDVVIADLTLGYCRYHGIQIQGQSPYDVSGLWVHNCHLVNCNEQFIKGSSSESDPVGATDGRIEQCLFEFTSGWAYQYYTGGIDIHKGVNWVVRDNLFLNLRTRADAPQIAEHAIHFWKRCPTRPQNVVVERNWIVNCDRGIGFGLVNFEGGHQGGASVIRHNVVLNDGVGPHTDVGIGLEHASGVQVDHNMVQVERYWAPIEYRFSSSSNLVFAHNEVNQRIALRDQAPAAVSTNNSERVTYDWFEKLVARDARAKSTPQAAFDLVGGLKGHLDLQGKVGPRPQGQPAAAGARAYQTPGTPPDADGDVPPQVVLLPGSVNGARLGTAGKFLYVYGNPPERGPKPDTVLLTEARRDTVWAAQGLAKRGARVIAPEKAADLLAHPETFWSEWNEKRFHDYAQQTSRLPVDPIPVARSVKGGDVFTWEGLKVRVLDTPGYTRDAVSYILEPRLPQQKIAFTGNLIRDDGKLQDLFSLQDAIPEAKVGGYHGWAGRLGDLVASLERIRAEKPDMLVPLRGPVIRDPAAAIDRLLGRLRAAYANYLSIDALRWYFKDDHILAKARRVLGPDARVDWMEMAQTLPLPAEIVALSNSRLILAADRSGFLVDCGGQNIVEELRKLRAAGRLSAVEHVFVTHYHDDHTDALPTLVREFGAQVHACGSLVDVIERPGDYRLPCLTKNPTSVTAKHPPAESWQWKEYRLTIYDFPGQTLHHNALLVQLAGGWTAAFVGDSFTPSGVDDYCLQNRNFLREGQGLLRCLDVIDTWPAECFLLNQHVEPAFRFSPAQRTRLRETLRARIPLLAALLPFGDPNYGLDDTWAVAHPYWLRLKAGEKAAGGWRLTNHSPRERVFRLVPHAPTGCRVDATEPLRIPAHSEATLPISVTVLQDTAPGLQVITADVVSEDIDLRSWVEMVVEVAR